MKNKTLGLLFIITIFGCTREEKRPEVVLSESEMINVITEFQVAEAIIRLGYHRSADSLIYNDSLYESVFKKLNITSEQFDTSYSYYSMRPKQFEEIYKEVITNLSTRAAELKAAGKSKKKK